MSSPSPDGTNIMSPPQAKTDPNDHQQQIKTKLIWNQQTEELVAGWGDIASCYKWLHDQAYHKYNKINYRMSIPIIILSTITGTISVGMASLVPSEYVNLAQQAVGGVNIITGIITTLQNFFRFAQLSEGHQHASLGWSKLERNIRIELKVDRKYRKDADSFLKVCRADYDRLLEQSPVIPHEVIARFKYKFKNIDIRKPDICDNLQTTEIAPVEQPVILVSNDKDVTEEPVLHNQRQEEILNEIKDLLSESRLVNVGMRDSEIPRWRGASTATFPVAPRKSFLGKPREPIHIDRGNISVKDMIRKFNTGDAPPIKVGPTTNPNQEEQIEMTPPSTTSVKSDEVVIDIVIPNQVEQSGSSSGRESEGLVVNTPQLSRSRSATNELPKMDAADLF